MANAAGAGLTPDEAEALQGLGVEGLPTGRRGPSTAQAPYELSAHPGLGHLRGERDVRVLVGERAQ
eukprot:1016918-Alexandrium_andersonii.AAC.1